MVARQKNKLRPWWFPVLGRTDQLRTATRMRMGMIMFMIMDTTITSMGTVMGMSMNTSPRRGRVRW